MKFSLHSMQLYHKMSNFGIKINTHDAYTKLQIQQSDSSDQFGRVVAVTQYQCQHIGTSSFADIST